MKKRSFAVLGIIIILTIALAGCSNSVVFSGVSVNRVSRAKATSWTIAAASINGHESRTVNLTADNLAALNVVSANSAGSISLLITQGNTTKTVDISGQYSGNPDMSGFTAGKVNLRLDYGSAKDINISITW